MLNHTDRELQHWGGGVRSFGRLIAFTRGGMKPTWKGGSLFDWFPFILLSAGNSVYKCYIYIHTDLIQVINRRFNPLTRGISCFKKKKNSIYAGLVNSLCNTKPFMH